MAIEVESTGLRQYCGVMSLAPDAPAANAQLARRADPPVPCVSRRKDADQDDRRPGGSLRTSRSGASRVITAPRTPRPNADSTIVQQRVRAAASALSWSRAGRLRRGPDYPLEQATSCTTGRPMPSRAAPPSASSVVGDEGPRQFHRPRIREHDCRRGMTELVARSGRRGPPCATRASLKQQQRADGEQAIASSGRAAYGAGLAAAACRSAALHRQRSTPGLTSSRC